jgi:PDZ domain-containing secreted protein
MSRYLLSAAAVLALSAWVAPAWAQRDDTDTQQSQQQTQQQMQQSGRPYLGATIEPNQEEGQQGAMVVSVIPNSPAAKAGLKKGDVITKIDNKGVHTFDDLSNVIHRHKVGDHLNIQVERNGQEKSLSVTLRPQPAGMEGLGQDEGQFGQNQRQPGRDQFGQGQFGQRPPGQSPNQQGRARAAAFLGVQTEEITPELKQERNLNADEGVLVVSVVPDSPAAQAGLRKGDVITKLNNKDMMNPDDLRNAIARMRAGQEVNLEVLRGNNHRQLTAQLEQSPDFGMQGQQPPYYGGFPNDQGQLGGQGQEIQRLQQRIQQLERRIRALEQHQQNQGGGTSR